MKFADFVCSEAIRAKLVADEKEGAINELAGALVEAGKIPADQRDDVVQVIMERERLGSTGLGHGVAVPHGKHACVDSLVGTVGVSAGGIRFDSLDGEKVFVVFLLVSPPEHPEQHLLALEKTATQLRNDTFRKFLKKSGTAEEIRLLLEEADNGRF